MNVPQHLKLTPQDYNTLLDVLDKTPVTGLQNQRAALALEQKLMANARAAIDSLKPAGPESPPDNTPPAPAPKRKARKAADKRGAS